MTTAPSNHLYQTPEWASVRAADGWHTERVAGPWGEYPALVRPIPLLGRVLIEVPYGPPGPYDDPAAVDELLSSLVMHSRRRRAAVVRIHPYPIPHHPVLPAAELTARFTAHAFAPDPDPLGYAHTYMIDLTASEEMLWERMEGRARTAVRKSERTDLVFSPSEDHDRFAELYFAMAARTGLVPEPADFFARMKAIAAPAGVVKLVALSRPHVSAETPDSGVHDVLAAALLSTVGDVVVYLWGASAPDAGAVCANERLQWEAIRWARAAGYRTYDLGGATADAPAGSKKAGIARFKRQFGGELVPLPGTHARVLDPWATRAARAMRRIRARLRNGPPQR